MIDPDVELRAAGLRRLGVLAAACGDLGTSIITLCTGTRDPDNMWRRHPDNRSPAAWADLTAAMAIALDHAQAYGVTLAIEPELSNVVSSPQLARRLLDEMRSPQLKIVIDGANLFHHTNLDRMPTVLQEAVALLGPDLVLAHVKELGSNGVPGNLAAGAGSLDYDRYFTLLRGAGYDGPLILHGLAESQVTASVAFLRDAGRMSCFKHRPDLESLTEAGQEKSRSPSYGPGSA